MSSVTVKPRIVEILKEENYIIREQNGFLIKEHEQKRRPVIPRVLSSLSKESRESRESRKRG